ncbi:Avr1b-1 avirulence protein [Globisporangium polare]
MVLRSLLRNASALALLLAVAASSQTTAVTSHQVASAGATAVNHHVDGRQLSSNVTAPSRKKARRTRRKLNKSGCSVTPGANSAAAATDDTTGNEAAQTATTEKPKTTKAPKTPKPSKSKKATTSAPTPAAATTAPSATTAVPSATTAIPSATTAAPTATTAAPSVAPATPAAASDSGSDEADEGTTAPASSGSVTKNGKLCAVPKLTVTDIDVGASVITNEDEAGLKVVAISAKPNGGSHIAYHTGSKVQVMELDASDKVVAGSTVSVNVVDFADIYSDAKGFVVLGTRDAQGGGTLNCGNPSNLCGTAPSPAVPCYDMYLIRFEGGKEVWATKLTSSSAALPPYSTSKTGANVFMIWWYAHHGRIAYDGTNWASYFGVAISTSESGCINIHQGDRMQVVGPTGALVKSQNSFDLGCSHSGYERITYDASAKEFAMICKTDNNNRIKFPNSDATIYPVNLAASNLGDIVPSATSGYWMTVSNGDGVNAKVHLMHFAKDKATDKDILLGGVNANERACHLASIGDGGLLAVWEGASAGDDLAEGAARTMYVQVRDAKDGAKISEPITVGNGVVGNRYQAFKDFPDGSVAYLSKGVTATKLKVLRITPC